MSTEYSIGGTEDGELISGETKPEVMLKLSNYELQCAIDSMLAHAGVQKQNILSSFGNDPADGAFSDCLRMMLYEQAKRAGCKF